MRLLFLLLLFCASACVADRNGLRTDGTDADASFADVSEDVLRLDLALDDGMPLDAKPDADLPDGRVDATLDATVDATPDAAIDATVDAPVLQARSCKEHRDLGEDASGFYDVSPQQNGTIREVYCDMEFERGGWTLILSTMGDRVDTLPEQFPLETSQKGYLPSSLMVRLARVSSEVLIREANTDRYIISTTSVPIENLRNQNVVSFNAIPVDPNTSIDHWQGPQATLERLRATSNRMADYPQVFWASGNTGGLHINYERSRWVYRGDDVPLQLWVR